MGKNQVLEALLSRAAWLGEPLHGESYPGFQRMKGLYGLLLCLGSLSCLLATLQASIKPHSRNFTDQLGQTLLTMSFFAGFTTIILAAILLFFFDSIKSPMGIDLGVAWIPVVLFDVSAILLLAGTSYSSQERTGYPHQRGVTGFLVVLLAVCTAISLLVGWRILRDSGPQMARLEKRE
jgi:hypothetical protein